MRNCSPQESNNNRWKYSLGIFLMETEIPTIVKNGQIRNGALGYDMSTFEKIPLLRFKLFIHFGITRGANLLRERNV